MSETVAVARPAASLILLRDGPVPALLMGLRGAGHRFMPNRLVFPGGAVDPEDHGAPCAAPLPVPVRGLLERGATPALAAALGHAAARELEEETGLSLGTPPALDGLDYIFRAITPEASPIRFDARFFVVDAARAGGTLAGSGELEDLRWFDLPDVLALDIARATRAALVELQTWLALMPAARAARVDIAVLDSGTDRRE